jgi:hypothetical protein
MLFAHMKQHLNFNRLRLRGFKYGERLPPLRKTSESADHRLAYNSDRQGW